MTPKPNGFAIISVLLVLTVLTIMVVAFMQSMRIERLTARSYLNKTKAELVAEAGVNAAIVRLKEADLVSPITAYEEHEAFLKQEVLLSPYLVAIEPDAKGLTISKKRFLASSADIFTPPSDDPKSADTMDINAVFGSQTNGLIGLRDIGGARREVPVDWIYLKDSDNKIVGRYAYWIDDESAKVNLSKAGSIDSTLKHVRKAGGSASEISLFPLLDKGSSVKAFIDFRGSSENLLRTMLTFRQAPLLDLSDADFEDIRGSLTAFSQADERGALGIRRINLNEWANAERSKFSTPPERKALAGKVVAMGDYINAALPDFGSRYYPGVVTVDDKRRYCAKIAGNIQDYIDTDSQPTVIRQDLINWQEPPDPAGIGEGAPTQPPAVFGKEVVPAIGEYVGFYYNDGGSLRIDHTFEVWNIHTKPIDLSKLGNVKILMAERNAITRGAAVLNFPGSESGSNPPLVINIPNMALLPAGEYQLLTTLPLPPAVQLDSSWVVGVPQKVALSPRENVYTYGPTGLRMQGDRTAIAGDANTEIVTANEFGYLDIQARVAQQGTGSLGTVNLITSNQQIIASQSFGNNKTATGNNMHRGYPLDSADPRSFTEVYPKYGESIGSRSSIAWRRNTSNSGAGSITRLGSDSSGVFPDNPNTVAAAGTVPEPLNRAAGNISLQAVSVISDGAMITIGELGFIYDPAISEIVGGNYTVSGGEPTMCRGGFRTLSIGSNRGEVEGPNRLTHVVPKVAEPLTSNRAYRLLDLFSASSEGKGLFNINSFLRDPNNLAFRCLLDEFNIQQNLLADADFAGPKDPTFPTSALEVQEEALIKALEKYVEVNGPFLSLGQMTNADIFNKGKDLIKAKSSSAGLDITPNARNTDRTDRGREEVFRNLVGLLTLKGSTFSVYAVGQAGELNSQGKFVTQSTSRTVKIVEMKRKYQEEDPLKVLTMPELLDNNKPLSNSITVLQNLTY